MGSTVNVIFSSPRLNISVQCVTGTTTISATGPTRQRGLHPAHTTQKTNLKVCIGTMLDVVSLFSNAD